MALLSELRRTASEPALISCRALPLQLLRQTQPLQNPRRLQPWPIWLVVLLQVQRTPQLPMGNYRLLLMRNSRPLQRSTATTSREFSSFASFVYCFSLARRLLLARLLALPCFAFCCSLRSPFKRVPHFERRRFCSFPNDEKQGESTKRKKTRIHREEIQTNGQNKVHVARKERGGVRRRQQPQFPSGSAVRARRAREQRAVPE